MKVISIELSMYFIGKPKATFIWHFK